MPDHRIPESGDVLSASDVELIFQAINDRHQKHPDEPMMLTAVLVMLNIGDRFAKVECTEQENCRWTGIKQDLMGENSPGGIPKCPNGHPLFQEPGLRLTWKKDI